MSESNVRDIEQPEKVVDEDSGNSNTLKGNIGGNAKVSRLKTS